MSIIACSVDGCERPAKTAKKCITHYKRFMKYGSHDLPPRALLKDSICEIPECGKRHFAAGMCSAHYTRLKRTGSATTRKLGEVVGGKRICATCKVDTPLEGMGRTQPSYCRACINAAARARFVYKPKHLGIKQCENCGGDFPFNKKQNLHCSAECAQATVNKRNWKHLQTRRARLKDAFVESFHSKEIYERDNWVCGICKESIDPAAKLPDQMSASIDHIIPISRGGTHERANAQAAHLFCNVSKGAKVTQ